MKKQYISPVSEELCIEVECQLLTYSTGFGDDPAENPANARLFEDDYDNL